MADYTTKEAALAANAVAGDTIAGIEILSLHPVSGYVMAASGFNGAISTVIDSIDDVPLLSQELDKRSIIGFGTDAERLAAPANTHFWGNTETGEATFNFGFGSELLGVAARENPDLVVGSVADLLALEIKTPYFRVTTIGHTAEGIGSATYYYDKYSTASQTSNMCLLHASGIGRWMMILGFNDPITPEHFGAIGDGSTYDGDSIYEYSRRVGNMQYPYRNNPFIGRGIYLYDDTFLINSKSRFTLEMGSYEGSSNFTPALLYDGPDGGGREPENTKPAVRFHRVNEVNLKLVVRNSSAVKPNSCGVMFTANDSNQRGKHNIELMHAVGFGYDYIIGLSGRPESTYIDQIHTGRATALSLSASLGAADTHNDDVFENVQAKQISSAHCRDTYFDCETSDGALINKMKKISYNPAGTSPDMGVSQQSIVFNKCGAMQFPSYQVLQSDVGVRLKYVDWAATVDTNVKCSAHGFSVGDVVHFPASSAWTVPALVSGAQWKYFEVTTVLTDSLTLKEHRTNGPDIDFSGGAGNGTIVLVDGLETATLLNNGAPNINIGKINCEDIRGTIMRKSGTNTGRSSGLQIEKISAGEQVRSMLGDALILESFSNIGSGKLAGNFRTKNVTAQSLTYFKDPITDVSYSARYVLGGGGSARPVGSVLNLNKLNSSGSFEYGNTSTFLDRPYSNSPGEFTILQNEVKPIPERQYGAIALTGNTITLSSTVDIVVGSPLIFKGGTLPNEIVDGKPYLVNSVIGNDITLHDVLADADLALTGTLSGTVETYLCVVVRYIGLRSGVSHEIEFSSDLVITQPNSAGRALYVSQQPWLNFVSTTELQDNWSAAEYSVIQGTSEARKNTTSNQTVTMVSGWALRRSTVHANYLEVVLVAGQKNQVGAILQAHSPIRCKGTTANKPIEFMHSTTDELLLFPPAESDLPLAYRDQA